VDLVRVSVRGLHPALQRCGCVSLLLQHAGYRPTDFEVMEECLPSMVLAGWGVSGGGGTVGAGHVGCVRNLDTP
jgi:hypothetical protein